MAAIVRLAATLLGYIIKLIGALRLAIPAIYIVLMCTVFSRWASVHGPVAVGLLLAMLLAVCTSWIVTLVKKIKEIRDF